MDAEELKKQGNDYFSNGNYDKAVEFYSKAIMANNSNHIYYTNRALCNLKLRNYDAVVEDARRALNLEKDSLKANYLLGKSLVELGEVDDGRCKLLTAQSLSKNQPHTSIIKDIYTYIYIYIYMTHTHTHTLHAYTQTHTLHMSVISVTFYM
eukprot:GHVR01038531.1.p1 GENE.GHVR01038531.1~~GHVR01038531.1.p1  ORF type:complete len:169 (-),score=40.10 GHVR01038531.1:99-554(-)